jgi:hypothetical protein
MTQIPLRKCYAIEPDETDQILLTIVLMILPSMSLEADYNALHGQHRHDICEAMTKFKDEQTIVEEARALALAGPAGATSAPPTGRDDHWGHCGYQRSGENSMATAQCIDSYCECMVPSNCCRPL